jgi:hypothetical protein
VTTKSAAAAAAVGIEALQKAGGYALILLCALLLAVLL